MIYQNSLGIFPFSLVPDGKLISNIYLLSLLLDQLSIGQCFSIQSEIKGLLKMPNIGINHKEYIYIYASKNLLFKLTNWCQNGAKSERLRGNMLINFGLIPIGKLGKPPCQHHVPKVMIYQTARG